MEQEAFWTHLGSVLNCEKVFLFTGIEINQTIRGQTHPCKLVTLKFLFSFPFLDHQSS